MVRTLKGIGLYTILGLLPLAFYIMPELASLPIFNNSIIFLFTYLIYIGLGAIAILGLKLNQTRIMISALLLLLMYFMCMGNNFLAQIGVDGTRLREIFTFAFPLSISAIFLTRERKILSFHFLLKLVIAFVPFLVFTAWVTDFNESYIKMVYFHFIQAIDFIEVPQLTILPVILMVGISLYRHSKKIAPFLLALNIGLIPLFSVAHIGMDTTLPPLAVSSLTIIGFLAITIMLGHSLFLMYWQRVYIDELTQIANRRALDEKLDSISGTFAIGMIDIDHFKKFNDTFGHDAGDDVLKTVASVVNTMSKAQVFRYGGEEFTALFPGMTAEEAQSYADETRNRLAKRDFFIRQTPKRDKKDRGKSDESSKKKVQITISIGLSESTGDLTPEEVIKNADKGLYDAKEAGRNCVKIKT